MCSALAATSAGSHAPRLSILENHQSGLTTLVGFGGLLAIVACAPFEATSPLLHLPGQSISSLETVLLVAFVAWAWTVVRARSVPVWQTPLTLPGLMLLATLTIAALAAPSDRTNALHMVGRLTFAAGLFVLTMTAVTSSARARTLMLVACATGAVAGLLVALDFTTLPLGQQVLAPFRTQVTTVGAQVRASGPFQYPTIASMFLEITFACGVGLLPLAIDRRQTRESLMLTAALLVTAAGIVLTYTRAGLITLAISLALVTALRAYRTGFDRPVRWLVVLAAVIALMIPLSRSTEAIRLRLMTEGQDGWYSASIDAPSRISMAAGSRIAVPVTLTNTGRVTWDSSAARPFGFSYHWLLADSDRIVSWEGIRSTFAEPVGPAGRVTVTAQLEAPRQPGDYRIVWDLYQEHLLWFSTEPDAVLTISRATVSGSWTGAALNPDLLPPMPGRAMRPSRRRLWSAAGRMLTERPWLGIGADNFRLRYGPYAGVPNPDPRTHANNMYLELLVGGGLLAGVAIVWLSWRSLALLIAVSRRAAGDESGAVAAGAVAAVTAIAVHGLVDSFLSFTATYSLMAISVGLLVASSRMAQTHAHRI